MRNVQRLNEMLKEVAEIVKAKGFNLDDKEMKRMMDITDYEMHNQNIVDFLINKLEVEKELNNFEGLANGIRVAILYEKQQEFD